MKSRAKKPLALYALENLANRAGLPMPKVCIIDADEPNAFTGRNPNHAAVAVTTGIMRVLDYNEMLGVLAHELAHVKNRDILTSTIASMMATVISYAAQFFMFFGGSSDDDGVNPIAAIAMMILAPRRHAYPDGHLRSTRVRPTTTAARFAATPTISGRRPRENRVLRHPFSGDCRAVRHRQHVHRQPFEGTGKALTKLFSTHPIQPNASPPARTGQRDARPLIEY